MRAENLWHRATYVFVFTSDEKLLVQRRTMIKDYCPGYLDPAPGGVIGAGESYAENAVRELEEEMGIRDVPLEHVSTFKYEDDVTHCWGVLLGSSSSSSAALMLAVSLERLV